MESPEKLTPQQAYQRRLVEKSHMYDELLEKYKSLQEDYDKLKKDGFRDDPLKFLMKEDELKLYQWIRSLPDNETGYNMITYAVFHGILDMDHPYSFFFELCNPKSPFFLPIMKNWDGVHPYKGATLPPD